LASSACPQEAFVAGREPVRGLVTEAMLLLGSVLVCGVSMFTTGFQRISDVPS